MTSAGQSSNWTTSGIKQVDLTLYNFFNISVKILFKDIKKTAIIMIEESNKTARYYGHLWLHLSDKIRLILCRHPALQSLPGGPFENNKTLHTCL